MEFTTRRFDPEQLLSLLMENSPVGIALLSTDLRYMALSRKMQELIGLPTDNLVGAYCYDVVGMYRKDPDRTGIARVCDGCPAVRALATGATTAHIRRVWSGLIVRITSVPLTDEHGEVVGVLELFEDISDKVTDPLTGVHNYRFYDEMLAVETARAERYGTPLSLLALDLNNFKRVNDLYGHVRGDKVLQHVADALHTAVRDSDHLCRVGGDEFAVLAPHTAKEQAETLAERIQTVVEGELAAYQITVSCGVAAYPEDTTLPDELREIADVQMYKAKDARGQAAKALPESE